MGRTWAHQSSLLGCYCYVKYNALYINIRAITETCNFTSTCKDCASPEQRHTTSHLHARTAHLESRDIQLHIYMHGLRISRAETYNFTSTCKDCASREQRHTTSQLHARTAHLESRDIQLHIYMQGLRISRAETYNFTSTCKDCASPEQRHTTSHLHARTAHLQSSISSFQFRHFYLYFIAYPKR